MSKFPKSNNIVAQLEATLDRSPVSPEQRLSDYLAGKYAPFMKWVSTPTAGDYAGRKLLSVPAGDIQSKQSGQLRVTLGFPEERNGELRVKIGIAGVVENGEFVTLHSGGGDEGQSDWVGINTSPIALSDLFAAGYFAEAAKPRVVAWCRAHLGESKLLPLEIQGEFAMVLRVTKVPVVNVSGRTIKTSLKPGDYAGIGADCVGFQGASLLPLRSSLMYAHESGLECVDKSLAGLVIAHLGGKGADLIQADSEV